jgi:hypothetical protein
MALACEEEIETACHLYFWQHLVPHVNKEYTNVFQPRRKVLFDGIELLMASECLTVQLVTNLHLMVPVVKSIIQSWNVV